LKFNKPYQAVCTLMQYCILTVLEKYGSLSIKTISDYLNFETKYVVHEVNFLFSNTTFNQKRMCSMGLIVPENHQDGKELTEDIKVSINKSFQNNSLKISTIPSSGPRVIIIIILEVKLMQKKDYIKTYIFLIYFY